MLAEAQQRCAAAEAAALEAQQQRAAAEAAAAEARQAAQVAEAAYRERTAELQQRLVRTHRVTAQHSPRTVNVSSSH